MTNEEQNIAVAEWLGPPKFVLKKRGLYYRPDANGYTGNIRDAWMVTEDVADQHAYSNDEPVTKHPAPIPDFGSDLNAMHEAEIKLRGCDYDYYNIPEVHKRWNDYQISVCQNFGISATASQRREALLRTLELWKD